MISVIIPVYNVEDYLSQCLDSVINQTYKDLEIILIDDGSTDKSPEICDSYMKMDSRIKVIHKENGGQSSARNEGLKIAEGEYIGYVDSDDYISCEMYETLFNIAEKYDADVVKGNYARFETGNIPQDFSDDTGEIKLFNSEDAILNLLTSPFSRRKAFSVNIWVSLYKKETIKNIRFPEGLLYDDGYYTPQVILSSEKLVHIDKTLYFYRFNHNSIMGNGFSKASLNSLDDWEFIHNCVRKKYPQHSHYAAEKWANKLITTYNRLLASPEFDCDGKYKEHIIKKINQNYSYFLASVSDENMKRKLKLLKKNPEKYEKKDRHKLNVKELIKKIIS